MNDAKPLASLSLDLDNQWSYLKTHGDPSWERLPTYLPVVVPRVLDFLRQRELTITFFVVGQDAVLRENRPALRSLADAGHEIGNHSFHHEPWLHLYSEDEIERELGAAEVAIASATGQSPCGFRGPGFSVSSDVLRVLARRGYRYDASTFPTYLGPLARAYYFMTAKLTPQQRREREQLFGRWHDGLRPVAPYRWTTDAGTLTEIPVTTMPLFKTPIHLSYLIYLSLYSPLLATGYFKMALGMCRLTHTPLSLLLHPLDFLGCDDTTELAFFPAMSVPHEWKLKLVGKFLDMMAAQFRIVPMCVCADQLSNLPMLEPDFPNDPPGTQPGWQAPARMGARVYG